MGHAQRLEEFDVAFNLLQGSAVPSWVPRLRELKEYKVERITFFTYLLSIERKKKKKERKKERKRKKKKKKKILPNSAKDEGCIWSYGLLYNIAGELQFAERAAAG